MSSEVSAQPVTDIEPDPKRWIALTIIAVAQLMIVLDASIVTIALPSAQRALHISLLNRQWVITAYTLAFGGLLLLGGRIADYMGRKRIFIIGLLGFAAASALGGAAQNGAMLFGARALQGCIAALMAPAALSLITVTFTEPRERAKAFGVYGAISGGGAAIGLIAGGLLTQYASWRWCLFVNVPIALLAFFAAIPFVKESRATSNTRYDIPGAVTSSAGFVALVYGFTRADQDGWGSAVTLAFLLGAVVLLALFVVIELRTEHPLLPMRVILERNRGGSFLGSFMAGIGLLGMFLFLTYYLQETLHYSPLKCGVAYLPFSGGIILAAGLASKLLPKYGPKPLMVGGFFAAAVALGWLTRIGVHSSFAAHVLPSEIVMSMGLGFAFVAMSSTALLGVSQHDAGVASALVNSTQQVGGSLGTALLNTVAASATSNYLVSHLHGAGRSQLAVVHGYSVAFTGSVIAMAFATVATLVLIHGARSKSAASSEPTTELNPLGGASFGIGAVPDIA